MKIRRTVSSRAGVAISAVAAASLTLSACGADSKAAVATPMPTMTTPVATPPPGQADKPNAGPLAVTIKDFAFQPASLTVKVGQAVTWTNQDEEPHTVIGDGGGPHSGVLGNAGSTYKFTFTKAGSYSYVCSIHPFMHGTVTVTG